MKNRNINPSVEIIFGKIKRIDLQKFDISDHTKEYLKKYAENHSFYESVYSQLLQKAIRILNRPVKESTFIDYGGGCGILSLIAKEAGFRTVVYNDIYDKSVIDAGLISKTLDLEADHYFCGDLDELINELKLHRIDPDLICSFDVLEHIYDLSDWLRSLSVADSFSLLFMSGANPVNPFIVRRLKKIHKIAEYHGSNKNIRIKDDFLNTSFLKQREIIIRERFPDLSKKDVNMLAKETRGRRKNDIEEIVINCIKTGIINYKMSHPTNTCDPYTGSWAEKLIDLKQIRSLLNELNMTCKITNSFYSYSGKGFPDAIKYILNQIIKLSGPENLFLSPIITLEIQKHISKNP